MKKKKLRIWICAVIAVALIAGASVYAATTYGTKDDPLVTKSYLDDTLTPELMAQFKTQLNSALAAQQSGSTAEGTFEVVTLSKGQTLTGKVGCEILLRIGTAAVAASSSPGLVDTTSGGTLDSGGALTANHLYMVSIAGNGVKATAAAVKVLVSGSYTIG